MKKILVSLLMVLGLNADTVPRLSENPTAQEIVERAIVANYYAGDSRTSLGYLKVVDEEGKVLRERRYSTLRMNAKEGKGERNQKYYVYFTEPSDLKGTSYLVYKNMKGSDDRWLRLDKMDLTKRIAATDKRTSFAGTDVLYEDVSGRHLDDDTHKIVEDNKNYWVIESTPKHPEEAEIKMHKAWIHKKSGLVIKRYCYNHEDKMYRTFKATKIANIDGGDGYKYPTVYEAVVKDLITGTTTYLIGEKIEYNTNLDDSQFTKKALSTPPMSALFNFNK